MCIHDNEHECRQPADHCCHHPHHRPPEPRGVTFGDIMLLGMFLCVFARLIIDIIAVFGSCDCECGCDKE